MRKVFYILPLLFCSLFSIAQPGLPEPSFGTGGVQTTSLGGSYDEIYGLAKYPGGQVIAIGVTVQPTTGADFGVVRYNADGSLDGGFGTGGIVTTPIGPGANDDVATSVAIQSDGKIVVGGFANMGGTGNDFVVVRYLADGTLDGTFGTGGIATINFAGASDDQAYSLVIQPADGHILIGGSSAGDFAVARLDENGDPDITFGGTGEVTTDIDVTAGTTTDNGTALALQTDGKIIQSGWTATGGPSGNDIAVVRYNADGTLDTGFDGDGIAVTDGGANGNDQSASTKAVVMPDGDIYIGGTSAGDFLVIRYNSDGSLDGGFDGDGRAITDVNGTEQLWSIAAQNDNKIIIVGVSGNEDLTTVRYTTTGALDGTYGTGGISAIDIGATSSDFSYAVMLTNLRVYVAGSTIAGSRQFAIAALQNNAYALPLNLLSFAAQKQNNNIAVTWRTEKEEGITQFIVERSADGKTFAPIGQVSPSKIGGLVKNYSFTDNKPLTAMNYYRLAIHEVDASVKHSKIVALKFNKQSKELEIYQNPVVNNQLRMQLPDGLTGRINIRIVDAAGRVVKTQALEAIGGSSISTTIDVSNLGKGVYFISIDGNNQKINKQFLKN